MRSQSFRPMSNAWRVGIITLGIMVPIVAGISPLVYDSPLTPLISGGSVVAMAVGVAWLRKPVWALYAAIFVIMLPTGLVPGNVWSLLTRLTLVMALGLWLLDAVTQRRRIVWTRTALLMLGFLIWATITLLWAPDLNGGMEKTLQYASRLGLFLVLIANEIDTRETLDGLMNVLALNGWIFVIAGVMTLLFRGYQPGASFQVLDTNINDYGVSLLITMPGVLWQALGSSEQHRSLRMSQSVLFVLLAFVLIALSGSRGNAIALLVILCAFWIWKPTRPWGKLGLLILAVAVISAPILFSTVVRRFSQEEGGALGGREMLWPAAWLIIRTHLWGGVGIGNITAALTPDSSMLAMNGGAVLVKYLRSQQQSVSLHSPVLQIWAETGIPGIVLYLGVLASAIGSFVRQYYQCRETTRRFLISYFALVTCASVAVLLAWSKGGGMEHDPTYFLLLGLLLIPSQLSGESGFSAEQQNKTSRR